MDPDPGGPKHVAQAGLRVRTGPYPIHYMRIRIKHFHKVWDPGSDPAAFLS
jgi:hypothetical protein